MEELSEQLPFQVMKQTWQPVGLSRDLPVNATCSFRPNFTTIRQSFHDGDQRVLVHIPSPNTHESCTVFWALAISPVFSGPAPEEQMAFAVNILNEGRLMCENQLPKEVSLRPSRSCWGVMVTPGDTLSKTFQQCFRKFLEANNPDSRIPRE